MRTLGPHDTAGSRLEIAGERFAVAFDVAGWEAGPRDADWADALRATMAIDVDVGPTYRVRTPIVLCAARLRWFAFELVDLRRGRRDTATLEDFELGLTLELAPAPDDPATWWCAARWEMSVWPTFAFRELAVDAAGMKAAQRDAEALARRWPPRYRR